MSKKLINRENTTQEGFKMQVYRAVELFLKKLEENNNESRNNG